MPLTILLFSSCYMMYALTRTDLMAHLANLVSRRKFESAEEFWGYVCDKSIFGFPYGELLTCRICLSAWVGTGMSLAQGFNVWYGLAIAGAWCLADIFLRGIDE